MAIIAALDIVLGAKTGKATKQLGAAGRAVNGLKRSIAGFATVAVGAIAATLSFNAAISKVNKSFDNIDNIAKQSRNLDIPIAQMQRLALASAKLSGITETQLINSLRQLQRRIGEAAQGTGEAVGALQRLEIPIDSISRQSADQQFLRIADALKQIKNPGEQAAIVYDLLGRDGQSLLTTLREGSAEILNQAQVLDQFGLTLSQLDASKVEAANDAWTELRAVVNGFAQQLAVLLSPNLKNAAAQLIEATGGADKLRDALSAAGAAAIFISKSLVTITVAGSKLAAAFNSNTGRVLAFATALVASILAIQGVIAIIGAMIKALRGFAAAMITAKSLAGPKAWATLAASLAVAAATVAAMNSAMDDAADLLTESSSAADQTADSIGDLKDRANSATSGLEKTKQALAAINEENQKFANLQQRANQLRDAIKTPFDRFKDELANIEELALKSMISIETAAKATAKALDTFKSATPTPASETFTANVASASAGTQAEFEQLFKQQVTTEVNELRELVEAQNEANQILNGIRDDINSKGTLQFIEID